jgi:hypothetical protein
MTRKEAGLLLSGAGLIPCERMSSGELVSLESDKP